MGKIIANTPLKYTTLFVIAKGYPYYIGAVLSSAYVAL